MSGQLIFSFQRMNSKMNCFKAIFAICCLWVAQARPGQHGDGHITQLIGVPDIGNYQHLEYPKFELQDLGTVSHGDIPPKTVKIYKTTTLKIPQPYPVKVPHNIPYPVPVAKPYPVPITKLVRVPHPVPVEVIKKVPVPIEVPKPYPVPTNEHSSQQGGGDGGHGFGGGDGAQGFGGGDGAQSFGGGDYSGHQQFGGGDFQGGSGFGGGDYGRSQQQFVPSYGTPEQSYGGDGQGYQYNYQGGGGYDGGEGSHGQADQSAGYVAVAPAQQDVGGQQQPEGVPEQQH